MEQLRNKKMRDLYCSSHYAGEMSRTQATSRMVNSEISRKITCDLEINLKAMRQDMDAAGTR
jgi:hypothetical protein